jgi:polyhydroxyalkanoate synthesis regulator phasin
MTLTEYLATASGGAAVTGGYITIQKLLEWWGKRAEAREKGRAATDAAEATGRHEVRVAEVSMVPELLERLERVEQREERERIDCAKQIAELRRINAVQAQTLVARDAEIHTLHDRVSELESQLADVRRALVALGAPRP